MSTLFNLRGRKVKFTTSDLTMSTATEGEVFYSNSGSEFKVGINVVAWASGGDMSGTRSDAGAGGTQTAAFAAGGYNPSGPSFNNITEEYDGSSWSNGGNLGTARYNMSGSGTLTAGLVACGRQEASTPRPAGGTVLVEEYDGSSWTESGDTSTGHGFAWMAGTQTASLIASGLAQPSPASPTTNAESYDGSSWTEGPNVNTARYGLQGFGTSTAMVVTGGTGGTALVEEYDGSSWSEVTNLPGARSNGSGSGSLTAGMVFCGNPGSMTTVFTYDGTNWASAAAVANGRNSLNRGLTITGNSSSMAFAGSPSFQSTEEYGGTITLKTITDS